MSAFLAALVAVLALASPAPATPAAPGVVSVTISRPTASLRVGQRIEFTTVVRNHGSRPLEGLVANLNVVSLRPDVYVDPEDWSTRRTQYLSPVPPHGVVTLPWKVQAVNDGDLVLYVAVTTGAGPGRVVSSDPLRLSVAARRTVDVRGALPVALGVPGLLAVLMVLTTARRRRLR